MLLQDKVIIVTGGGRGIGAAICRVVAREGAIAAVNYQASEEKALGVVESIRREGGRASAYQADVRDTEQVQRMVDQVVAEYGRIDGLVNNAIAGRQGGKLEETTLEDYSNSFDYGARAVINTIKAVRPIMGAQGGGRIVNIVSEQWNFGSAHWSVYMAGKGAMVGISRSLADELGPEGITVNMVAPGWMRDEKVAPEMDVTPYIQSVPLRRQADAEEIGNACVFLMSHLGSYVTGAYIPVTGGKARQMG